jgi:hypothetical protein
MEVLLFNLSLKRFFLKLEERPFEAQVEKKNFHQFKFSFSQGEGNGRFSQMDLRACPSGPARWVHGSG